MKIIITEKNVETETFNTREDVIEFYRSDWESATDSTEKPTWDDIYQFLTTAREATVEVIERTYTTYYISSNGQPANNVQKHDTIKCALDAWKSNIGALLHRSGGMSILIHDAATDEDSHDTDDLRWISSVDGEYAAGTLLNRLQSDEPLSPDDIVLNDDLLA